MIHALFIAFLIMVLIIIYKNDNIIINGTVNTVKQEAFHSKSKQNIYDPYKSEPLMLEQQQTNDLLTEETTGINRNKFKNIETINYLGEIESRPAPNFKMGAKKENEYKILENDEPNLRGLYNMSNYNE